MANAGAAKMVVVAVQHADRDVVSTAITFATSLFHGGNAAVQGALLTHLEAEDRSQAFLHALGEQLRGAAESLRCLTSELAVVTAARARVSDGVRQHMLRTKKDVLEVRSVLRFVQLLCEGHHLPMQNYLRDQPGDRNPCNVVMEVMGFLKEPIRCICSGVRGLSAGGWGWGVCVCHGALSGSGMGRGSGGGKGSGRARAGAVAVVRAHANPDTHETLTHAPP